MVTPLVMGNLIIRHGVLECMIVYQVILAQVIIVAMTFKKPYFIIPETTAYNILDVSSYKQGEGKKIATLDYFINYEAYKKYCLSKVLGNQMAH